MCKLVYKTKPYSSLIIHVHIFYLVSEVDLPNCRTVVSAMGSLKRAGLPPKPITSTSLGERSKDVMVCPHLDLIRRSLSYIDKKTYLIAL